MAYSKRIPNSKDIVWLSKLVNSYPTTRREVVKVARMWNLSNDIVVFLRQFPPDKEFATRIDLVNNCESRATRIRQEWESPHKITS